MGSPIRLSPKVFTRLCRSRVSAAPLITKEAWGPDPLPDPDERPGRRRFQTRQGRRGSRAVGDPSEPWGEELNERSDSNQVQKRPEAPNL